MVYTTKDIFILSANGCMDTEPDSLESILAGTEEGARGCSLSVDMSADGIAVLSSDGTCAAADGGRLEISEHSYTDLHLADPHLVPAGQAIDLARTCHAKLALCLRNQTLLPQLRMTLRHADYLDDTIFIGLGLVEAARLAVANPDLHIMGELPALPDNIDSLVSAAQQTGLFGLRAAPTDLTPPLLKACKRAGLFTMSLPTKDPRALKYLVHVNVNFIETARPDLALHYMPDDDRPAARPILPLVPF